MKGPKRRQGLELEPRARLAEWLTLDAEYAQSDARFRETSEPVPPAPIRLLSRGTYARTGGGLTASLRARYPDDRPAIEDRSFTARGYTALDARAGLTRGPSRDSSRSPIS